MPATPPPLVFGTPECPRAARTEFLVPQSIEARTNGSAEGFSPVALNERLLAPVHLSQESLPRRLPGLRSLRFGFVGFTSENVNRSKKEKLHGAPWFSRTDRTGDGRSSRWSRSMEFKPDFYSHGRFSSDENAPRGSPALVHCTHALAGDFRLFPDRGLASQSLPPAALDFRLTSVILRRGHFSVPRTSAGIYQRSTLAD